MLKVISFILGLICLVIGIALPMNSHSKDKIIMALSFTLVAFALLGYTFKP